MLRLHLPPNFAAAVVRNAVPIRVEFDLSQVPATELVPVLALLQRWCTTPTPPTFIQLNRAQLRELAAAAGSQPIYVENGRATEWRHADLVGEPRPAADTAAPSTASSSSGQNLPRRTPVPASGLIVDGSEHFLALTLPSREHAAYEMLLALVKENGFTLEPSNRKWWLRDRHRTLRFLAENWTRLREEFGATFTANFERNAGHIQPVEITADVASAGREFSVAVGVKAGAASEQELRSAIASNRGYVESNGRVYLLDPERLQKLVVAQRAIAGDPNTPIAPNRTAAVPAARAVEVQDIVAQLSPNFQPPQAWRDRTAALRNRSNLAPAPVRPELEALLRPYQRLGIAWLFHLQKLSLGGVLADEMGLGKTLQALALLSAMPRLAPPPPSLANRRDVGPPKESITRLEAGPALVVCPASLLENWRREALRFTPQLRVFVHHGQRRLEGSEAFTTCDLVITSYGTLTRDQSLFAAIEFGCVVADEAQHIKNRRSQNAAALRALRARARFVLTGTPIENSLEDLRSLFDFLLPGYLTRVPTGLRGDERAWYDERLRQQTAPYILRRTKKSVAPELPDKIEQVVWCELTSTQAALYRQMQERSERELIDLAAAGATEAKLKLAALTQLLRLRQICCDPRLVQGEQNAAEAPIPPYADSAKLDAFRELIEEAIDDGHRVLVFSQFTSLLALLRAELDATATPYCYLDGSMPAPARQQAVDQFQHTPNIPLFLLSLKAGGTGLNLTAADTVVHYDPWWNPAAEAQATDRAHRIGQKRTVTSYKLIAAGTVEEKVLALQAEKRALLADVFEASDAVATRLSLADLKSLLS